MASFFGLGFDNLGELAVFRMAVERSNFGAGESRFGMPLKVPGSNFLNGVRRVEMGLSTGTQALLEFQALVGESAVLTRLLGDGLGEDIMD